MNQDQFLGALKIIVPSAVSYLVGKGYIPAGTAADVGTAIVTVLAASWSWWAHRDSARIAAVAAMPDIAKVVIAAGASSTSAAAQAANDRDQTKVTRG